MARYGYFLSSEEYDPAELVRQAKLAEAAGFESLAISDHFHPWLDEQGSLGLVWSVIGAISQVTSLPITTFVTCPTVRIHPAILAQAAATSAILTGGRFVFGVGSGEALIEHIPGQHCLSAEVRLQMLKESVSEICRAVHRPADHPPRSSLHGRDGSARTRSPRRAAAHLRVRLRR